MLKDIRKHTVPIIINILLFISFVIVTSFGVGQDIEENKSLRFDTNKQKMDVIKFSENDFVRKDVMESKWETIEAKITANGDKSDLILEILKAK